VRADAARIEDPRLLTTAAELFARAERTIECSVRGTSMSPTLPDGCRIRVRCGVPARVPVGEIVVLAVAPGILITHRVLKARGWNGGRGHLLTQGDGAVLCDEPIPMRAFVGCVIAFDDGAGWIVPGNRPRRTLAARWGAASHRLLIAALMAVHPELARQIARLSYFLCGIDPPASA
jgi:hypothetical protein